MEIIQYFLPPIPKTYQFCLDNVKAMSEKMGIKYTLIQDKINAPPEYRIVRDATDWLRLKLISEDPERFWLDSDMLLIKLFDFEFKKGKPYIVNDICPAAALYGNSCKEQIKSLFSMEHVGTIHKHVGARPDDYFKIPNGYILHLHLGCMLDLKRTQNQMCKLKTVNGEQIFESIKGFSL